MVKKKSLPRVSAQDGMNEEMINVGVTVGDHDLLT